MRMYFVYVIFAKAALVVIRMRSILHHCVSTLPAVVTWNSCKLHEYRL